MLRFTDKKLDTRLTHGIAFLEELAESYLIWNDELLETKFAQEKPDPIFGELISMLSPYSSECESIKGAMIVYRERTPDWGRQCMNSCRTALVNLIISISGENDWRVGLKHIVPSNTRRKIIADTYAILSAYGTHGDDIPAEVDVDLGIGYTRVAIGYLIESSRDSNRTATI